MKPKIKRFESGAHKRRKIEREKNLIDKTRKVSSFFHVVQSQSEIERRPCNSPSSTEPQNHLLIDNDDPAIEVSQFSSSTFSEQGGKIVLIWKGNHSFHNIFKKSFHIIIIRNRIHMK